MTTFLDTNVIIALLKPDDPLHAWSSSEFAKCKAIGPAVICDIVYCEASAGMHSQADLDLALDSLGVERVPEPDAALFRAGQLFKAARDAKRRAQEGGIEHDRHVGVMPDYLIGAVAEANNAPLVTANPRDFIRHFPMVRLVQPPA